MFVVIIWLACYSISIGLTPANDKVQQIDNFSKLNLNLIWKFYLVFQPRNSPDLNVLDVEYFNSIHSLQYHSDSKIIQDLVEVAWTSFDALHWTKLKGTFLTIQKVIELIILCNGKNNFKVPYICKKKLERKGQLPVSIKILDSIKKKL